MAARILSLGPNGDRLQGDAIQTAIDSLAAQGGGTLALAAGVYRLDRPLVLAPRVSIEGAGPRRTILRNVRRAYAFRASSIILPGNFHPAATQAWYGDPTSDPLRPVAKGSKQAVLRNSSRDAAYRIGDVVAFVDRRYTALVKFRVPYYVALRKIIDVQSGRITVDRPFGDDFVGFVHNLRTTNLLAEPVLQSEPRARLFVWHDASFGNLSVDTAGYWIADSATMGVSFHDIDVMRARALHYGNTFQQTRFERVSGNFTIKVAELSHNCEDLLIDDWHGRYRPEPDLDVRDIVSIQESSIGVIVRRGNLDVTGITKGPVLRAINGNGLYQNINIVCRGSDFKGIVVAIGDVFGQKDRRVSEGMTIEGVQWAGPCDCYLNVSGTIRNFRVDRCLFSGPVRSGFAFRVRRSSGAGNITNCDFQQGRGLIEPGGARHNVSQNYLHDGFGSLSPPPLAVPGGAPACNGFRATAARERFAIAAPSPLTVPAGQPFVLHSTALPAGGLRPGDCIAVSGRVRGLSGPMVLRLRDSQQQRAICLLQWQPNGSPRVTLAGDVRFAEGGHVTASGVGAACFRATFAYDAQPWTLELVSLSGSGAQPASVEGLSLSLTNPVLR